MNCDITVLARNMVVRKWSWALNRRMGKRSYGCGITGILSKVTDVWWWNGGFRR